MDILLAVGILLFIAGFILIGIEMVIPGFGAPGICGIICLVAGGEVEEEVLYWM